MPTIKNVSWTAENMPSGILFNNKTGVFSGIPTDVGEYSVPVTVTTEYGSDTKNIDIVVEQGGTYRFVVQAQNDSGFVQQRLSIKVED